MEAKLWLKYKYSLLYLGASNDIFQQYLCKLRLGNMR